MVRSDELANISENAEKVSVNRVENLDFDVVEFAEFLQEVLAEQFTGQLLGAACVEQKSDFDTLLCFFEKHASRE